MQDYCHAKRLRASRVRTRVLHRQRPVALRVLAPAAHRGEVPVVQAVRLAAHTNNSYRKLHVGAGNAGFFHSTIPTTFPITMSPVRDLSACSAQGVCAYIASSSFECSSRAQQKNGDGRFSTLADAVDTSGIVIFIVVRTYFVIPAKDSVAKAILPPSIFL